MNDGMDYVPIPEVVEYVSKDYRRISLNKLCPACREIIKIRREASEAFPGELVIEHPDSILIRITTLNRILTHDSHLEVIWKGKGKEVIVK